MTRQRDGLTFNHQRPPQTSGHFTEQRVPDDHLLSQNGSFTQQQKSFRNIPPPESSCSGTQNQNTPHSENVSYAAPRVSQTIAHSDSGMYNEQQRMVSQNNTPYDIGSSHTQQPRVSENVTPSASRTSVSHFRIETWLIIRDFRFVLLSEAVWQLEPFQQGPRHWH